MEKNKTFFNNNNSKVKAQKMDQGRVIKFDSEYIYRRVLKMAELKAFILFYNIFGFSISVYTLFLSFFNVDVFTRSVLGLLSIAFLIVKIISASLSTYRKHRSEMIDIRQKNLEIRKQEIEVYEKETTLIQQYKS